jgi:ferritin
MPSPLRHDKTINRQRRTDMISQKMQDAINEQIKYELESAYLYLSMVAYFREENLDGMAQWMTVQTQEELTHAMKLFDHVLQRDGKVELKALSKPTKQWSSPLEAFKAAYAHEQSVTQRIDGLVKIASQEQDHAAGILLQWFVTEQVEEEDSTNHVVQMLQRAGDSAQGLFLIDRELGSRTASAPAAETDTAQ